jgi:hypothetical protein
MARASRKRGRRASILGIVAGAAVAAMLAACGANPSASPAASSSPAPSASPSATPAPDGSPAAATPRPPGAFTIDLADGWQSVPIDGDHAALLAELAATNPEFAESIGARLAALPDSASYVAFDGSKEALSAGEVATLTVTEVDLPPDVALQTFATTVQSQVEQLVESDVELRPILVTGGQAYSLAYLAPLTRPDGEPGMAAVTQVLYVLPGRGYVVTFAVPPERANDYAQEVAGMAQSFAIAM